MDPDANKNDYGSFRAQILRLENLYSIAEELNREALVDVAESIINQRISEGGESSREKGHAILGLIEGLVHTQSESKGTYSRMFESDESTQSSLWELYFEVKGTIEGLTAGELFKFINLLRSKLPLIEILGTMPEQRAKVRPKVIYHEVKTLPHVEYTEVHANDKK